MSILPGYEPRLGTVPAKVEYEIAIEYQLKKIIYFSDAFTHHFLNDKHPNDLYDDSYFQLDTVITSVATLAEYYFSNIIYSVIGTVIQEPLAPHFAGFINGNYEEKKKKVFDRYQLGVLTKYKETNQDKYLSECNKVFDETLRFILNGKYDLLFDINNYIKHNNRIRGFCLKIRYDVQKYHFIRFSTETAFMLKSCMLKDLIEADFNELQTVDKNIYNLNGVKFEHFDKTGAIYYLKNNDTIFVKSSEAAGVTTKSLMKMSYELCIDIIDVIIGSDKGYITRMNTLNDIRSNFIERKEILL